MIRNLKRLFHGRTRLKRDIPAPSGGRVRMNRDQSPRCRVCGRDLNVGVHAPWQPANMGNKGCDPASRSSE